MAPRASAVRKTCRYAATGLVTYDEFRPAAGRPVVGRIGRALAGHYGLTEDERTFLENLDRPWRSP